MDERLYQTLILAGLLHDVGKFVQKPAGRSVDHPRDSADFLRRHRDGLARWEVDVPLLESLVRCHHMGRDHRAALPPAHQPAAELLNQADHYSSGERMGNYLPEEEKFQGFTPLECGFVAVNLGFAPTPDRIGYQPCPLHPARAFPTVLHDGRIDGDEIGRSIAALEQGVATALEASPSFDALLCSLLALSERYTWATPSDLDHPDISIHDHVRTVCALTACLALYHDRRGSLDDLGAVKDESAETLLLVEGSLAGIQDYLYAIANIGPGGVAKRLRARSFFITALVDVTAHRLLHELVPGRALPLACRLMNKGGRFTLLAPNLPEVKKNLDRLAAAVNGWLLEELHGSLAFCFASAPMAGQGFERKKIGAQFRALEQAHAEAKARRLAEVLAPGGAWREEAFVQSKVRYKPGEGACRSCNQLPAQAKKGYLCSRCDHQRQIGERLLTARYLAYGRGPSPPDGRQVIGFFAGDDRYYVALAGKLGEIPAEPAPYLVEGLPEPGGEEPIEAAWGHPYADRYLANYVARFKSPQELEDLCRTCPEGQREDSPCDYCDDALDQLNRRGVAMYSFGCIAARSAGRPLIGLLKADADRLGWVFSQGLGERDCLSRRAMLSRMVDLFFGGWLDHLLATEFKACYTVYSGGDDLLIAGPWDKLIDLAQAVDAAFHKFTARNGNLTLSAGLAFVKPRYPVARAAEDAGEALEDAKRGDGDGPRGRRDRLTVLGDTLRWDDLPQVMADVNALKERPVTSAFLYNLSHYADLYWRYHRHREVDALRYKPLLAYDIARNLGSADPAVREWADGLMRSLSGDQPDPRLAHLGLVARYLQFARRRR